MKIAIGSDHAGFRLKKIIADHLAQSGHEVLDLGTHDEERVDYPDFGAAVGQAVTGGDAELGICTCGSGIGISIAANKVPGVRAAMVHDVTSARLSREHNNANVLCLGERLIGETTATDAVDAFLAATFQEGRHAGRIKRIAELEQELQKP